MVHAAAGSRSPQVAAVLRATLEEASDLLPFRQLLIRLLTRPGRVLAPDGPSKWPAFVLETCRVLGGEPSAAVQAAAAIELIVAAADVADDLVDDEWDASLGSRSRALNATCALLLLAQRSIAQLEGLIDASRTCLIADMVARNGLAACAGQDLDLEYESPMQVDEDQAHEMTIRKSGSIVAMACQVGAAVATDDRQVLQLAGRFGTHVGTVAQLLNDLAGIDPARLPAATDLKRRKKTLPVAYGLRCAREEHLPLIFNWYAETAPADAQSEHQLAQSLLDLGAHQYTWIVAETHRREALACLDELATLTGRIETHELTELVPRLSKAGELATA